MRKQITSDIWLHGQKIIGYYSLAFKCICNMEHQFSLNKEITIMDLSCGGCGFITNKQCLRD